RAFLDEFDAHLATLPFLFGGRPSIGDFALFGPLYAHLYRDPASGRLMQQLAPRVAAWVERMRAPAALSGEFVPGDVVPKTLEPILARVFHEFGPVLASTIERLASVPLDHENPVLPRSIGRHSFQLREARGERAIYPFNVWRWQRAFDHYRGLVGEARARADALLDRVGGRTLMGMPLTRRLARVHNQLVFETEA
ncbi:MAG TPA: glutathione S-transferase C-terminal domain-containing protein, partial [Polyangiales bacterium]|nr:glutathione S-transferase C-terminal domain-containing protein [Polyangiales bacterium]